MKGDVYANLDSGKWIHEDEGRDQIVYGSKSTKTFIVATDNNTLYAGANNNVITLHAFSVNDVVYGETGNDFIGTSVNTKNPTIYGGKGNDTIRTVTSVKAYADGGEDNDLFIPLGSSKVTMVGGAGNDTFWFIESTTASLSGGAGNNLYRFDPYYLFGPYHNDVVITDISSNDTIRYDEENSDTTELSWHKDSKGNVVLEDTGFRFFSITLQGVTDIKQVADVTYRSVEDTKTLGEIFSDDIVDDDVVTINSAGTGVTILSGYEEDTFDVTDYGDKLKTIDASEVMHGLEIYGNTLANRIIGSDNDDTLSGGDGKDTLSGGSGNDKLLGGNGNDSLSGGTGNDTLSGGAGNDLFVYTAGNDVITDYAAGDKISVNAAISASSVKGSDATFTIGENTLTVKNGKGAEIVFIDADGNERTIIGGAFVATNSTSAKNTLAAWREVGDASARTTAIQITGNTLNNTILGGSGKDTLYGKDGADYLVGNAGADKLYGQNGDDTLWGGIGNDTLWGGAGADVFIYNAGEGKDVISGFDNNDLLQITGNWTAAYNESANTIAFKVGSTASAITLKNFTATTFNVSGTDYQIKNGAFVKK